MIATLPMRNAVCTNGHKNLSRGFPDSSIDQADEDVELSKRIYNYYGLRDMGYESAIKVRHSTRRIRQLGYRGLVLYYWNPGVLPSQSRRIKMTGGEIDKR